jgi:hypothetical protein
MTIFYLYCNNELSTTTVRKPDQRQQPVRYVANKSIVSKQFEAYPSNGSTAQVGPWPPPLRFLNHTELDTR